jgi:hypothetical protein
LKKIKIILTSLALTISLSSSAQLNPIKDLFFSIWYNCPYTFFFLSWTKPDASLTDTLVGYNIYINNNLYRFYTDTIAAHNVPQDTTLGGDKFLIYATQTYIHVTAVYNSKHIESTYNDSAFCGGTMGVEDDFENKIINIYPNPINNKSFININSPKRQIKYYTIVNSSGQLVKQTFVESTEVIINPDEIKLEQGLFILQVFGDNYCVTKKMLKIE